jgi:HSP20 family protein
MTDEGKKKRPVEDLLDEGATVDFKFGGMLKGLEGIIEGVQRLQKLAETGDGKTRTGQFSIPGLGEEGKGVFGFSIGTLGSGKVKVEPFGNVRTTDKGPEVDEVREPIVDLFEEGETVQVLIEMPGVNESKIETEIRGDILTVTGSGSRSYAKEVLLPFSVKQDAIKKVYHNGILELRFERA